MTASPWIAGLVACTVAAVVAYGIARLVAWFARRLAEAEWLDKGEPVGSEREAADRYRAMVGLDLTLEERRKRAEQQFPKTGGPQ